MLKSVFKEMTFSLFDKKARSIIHEIIFKCETFEQFEYEFNAAVKKTEGYGDLFKATYYVTRSAEKAQVWRRSLTGKDKNLFDIIELKY